MVGRPDCVRRFAVAPCSAGGGPLVAAGAPQHCRLLRQLRRGAPLKCKRRATYAGIRISRDIRCVMQDDALHIVMDYADGGDLSDRIKAAPSQCRQWMGV